MFLQDYCPGSQMQRPEVKSTLLSTSSCNSYQESSAAPGAGYQIFNFQTFNKIPVSNASSKGILLFQFCVQARTLPGHLLFGRNLLLEHSGEHEEEDPASREQPATPSPSCLSHVQPPKSTREGEQSHPPRQWALL